MSDSRLNRKFLRKVIEFPVRVRVLASARCPSGEVPGVAGRATSFSVGGIGFETTLALAVGDSIQLAFTLPGETRELHLEGTVQSIRAPDLKKSRNPALVCVGIKFRNVAPPIATYLTNYMTGSFILT